MPTRRRPRVTGGRRRPRRLLGASVSDPLAQWRQLYLLVRELHRYDKDRLNYIEQRRRRDGKNFWLGDDTLVITDGVTAKKTLADTNRAVYIGGDLYTYRQPIQRAKDDTAMWMPARRAVQRSIRRHQVAAHADAVARSFEGSLCAVRGERIDVVQTMRLASGVVNCRLVLGSEAQPTAEVISKLVDSTLPLMNSSVSLPSWAPTPRVRRQRMNARRLRQTLTGVVDSRMIAPRATPEDILDELVGHPELSRNQVIAAAAVTLIASFGAPGVMFAWVLLQLKRDPQLEVAARAAARCVTDLTEVPSQAPLLNAIVCETLRLYPAAWLISRIAAVPFAIDGQRISPGTNLEICLYSIHRDLDEWDDAAQFVPKRWLDTSAYRKGIFLPFGGGERVCVGSHLGFVELLTMLVVFLREYDLYAVTKDETPAIRTMLVPSELTGRLERSSAAGT